MNRAHLKLFVTLLTMHLIQGCQHATVAPPASGSPPATSAAAATRPAAEEPTGINHHILMIPGEIAGKPGAVVYVIDEDRGWLSAIAYDERRKLIIRTQSPID